MLKHPSWEPCFPPVLFMTTEIYSSQCYMTKCINRLLQGAPFVVLAVFFSSFLLPNEAQSHSLMSYNSQTNHHLKFCQESKITLIAFYTVYLYLMIMDNILMTFFQNLLLHFPFIRKNAFLTICVHSLFEECKCSFTL